MKNKYLSLVVAFALTLIGGIAIAGGNELAYFKLQELPALAGASVSGSTDYVPVYDTSAGKVKKVLSSAFGGGGAFNGTVGATTPSTGAFTTIAASGASTLSGDVVGDGGDQLYGFLQDQVASTTVAITAAQCGKTFVSNSADVMTLPEASTVLGCRLTFVCGTADDFDVNPADGTDQITSVSTTNGTTAVVTLAPAAGDAIRCTDIGGSITLEAVGANAWSQVAGGNGIWTDVN